MLKLLCYASDLPSGVRQGQMPGACEQVACALDGQKVVDFLPSSSHLLHYYASDVALPATNAHCTQVEDALQDRHYGVWAGRSLRDMSAAEQLSFLSDPAFAPPEGESFSAFCRRTTQWLEAVGQMAQPAVVLARPAVVRSLVTYVLYPAEGSVTMAHAARVDVQPGRYSLLTCHAGQWRVGMLNAPA